MSGLADRAALAVAGVLATFACAAPASALQTATTTIDGPRAEVFDLGGVAMAADGTGGVVYRAREGGRLHVFVAAYASGRWGAPRRVDRGQAYDSSFPAIAAGSGGRLVVAWVQEAGAGTDRLYAAHKPPGQAGFGAPAVIDPAIGEASGTFPSLGVADSGRAWVAYGVPTGVAPGGQRTFAEYRLARSEGGRWLRTGVVNRDRQAPVAPLTAASAPKVGVDARGNAVVAFQEPDRLGIDRVWARRAFRGGWTAQQLVSADTLDGADLRAPVDGFALAVSAAGEALVAWRQQPGTQGALGSARVLAARLAGPDTETDAGPDTGAGAGAGGPGWRQLGFADGAGGRTGALAGAPDAPQAALGEDGSFRIAFGVGTTAVAASGDRGGVRAAASLGSAGEATTARPGVAAGSGATAVIAWGQEADNGSVAVLEQPLGSELRRGISAARYAGPIGELAVEGSGYGDALVAYRQGTGETGQIAAVAVDAPPAPFALALGEAPVRPGAAEIAWDPAHDASGDVRYRLVLDGRAVVRDTRETSARLPAAGLEDGTYRLRVVAVDASGQETASPAGTLRVDGDAPRARFTWAAGRRELRVRVDDGRGARAAGVDEVASSVRWGDGPPQPLTARMSHVYRRAGAYRVEVVAVDRAGNRRTVVRRVVVR